MVVPRVNALVQLAAAACVLFALSAPAAALEIKIPLDPGKKPPPPGEAKSAALYAVDSKR